MSTDGREGRPAPPTKEIACPLCKSAKVPGLLRYNYRHSFVVHSVPLCPAFASMKPAEVFGALVLGAARAQNPRGESN